MTSDSIRQAYNSVPYASYPFAFSQPERLSAIAHVFGFSPVAIEGARVLELGCASGGNIIPLAARFPGSSFTGIDVAERQIEAGNKLVSSLDLKNIRLRGEDFRVLEDGSEEFDYIICHGVLSWVPGSMHEMLFRIVRRCLSPNGLAVVSFNVLPGAHLRSIARDVCLGLAKDEPDFRSKVSGALQKFLVLAQGATGADQYSNVIRSEAERMRGADLSYIAAEYMSPVSSPLTFSQFCDLGAAYGLSYLSDAELYGQVPRYMCTPAQSAMVASLAEGSGDAQRIADLVTGRSFRRSILVRSGARGASLPSEDSGRLAGLHYSANFKFAPDHSPLRSPKFVTQGRKVLSPQDKRVGDMMSLLAEAAPSTCSFDQLVPPGTLQADRDVLLKALFDLWGSKNINASWRPLVVGKGKADMPTAWRFARAQAQLGSDWVTGQNHEAVRLDANRLSILPFLDGKNAVEKIAKLAGQKTGPVPGAGARTVGQMEPGERLAFVRGFLTFAADSALLEPD